jgi:hypothetical protein
MSRVVSAGSSATPTVSRTSTLAAQPAYQAYVILHVGFAALPVIAGVDKFSTCSSIGISIWRGSSRSIYR